MTNEPTKEAKPKIYEQYRANRDQAAAENVDLVDHPSHYQHASGIEPIQITQYMDFLDGNVIKYVMRADKKGGLLDYKKAAWYLARKIELLEAEQQTG
jgi:hypothetical protein